MAQTNKQSIIEVIANTVIGFIISVGISIGLFPLMGIPITLSENISITIIFTIVGVIRSFIMRRIFNKLHN